MNSLKALLYFSIFRYPLSAKEIYLFSTANNEKEIADELMYLKEKGVVSHDDNYYFIEEDTHNVSRRIEGNKMAKAVMDKAIKKGVFISKFPYIEAVGISGALSKNYHDKDSDVDFFVITKSNRLWIARTLLMLYKKIFLFNSRKFFCVNYFISEDHLKITEQNLFTAMELLTLIPISGDFKEFYAQNRWVSRFLPNMKVGKVSIYPEVKQNWFSRAIVGLLTPKLGDFLDAVFLKITLKKWRIKFDNLSKEDFNIAMKSTSAVSKHHPQNFQKKVIDRLNARYNEFQTKYDITLEKEHA